VIATDAHPPKRPYVQEEGRAIAARFDPELRRPARRRRARALLAEGIPAR
jgi:hypothetical protein